MAVAQIIARDELKAVQRTARDALRAVSDLERVAGGDVFGRFVIEKDEPFDDTVVVEAVEFLRHARHLYPSQELCFVLVARVSEPGREDANHDSTAADTRVQR